MERNAISAVTPPPGQLSRLKSNSSAVIGGKSKKVTPVPPKKPSNQALAVHKKWQDVAKTLGGERIVVSKPAAKKLIFDLLKDSFRPMNITDIFKRLKGVVPSPVLKSSLDDMALDNFSIENQFIDSDDEDNDMTSTSKKKPKTSSSDDEYTGTLSIKPGRNTNTTLYYVDYTKLFNNGNGLLPDDRNTLLSAHEIAKAEKEGLSASLNSISSETIQLLSEPTNAEGSVLLEAAEETAGSLLEQLESAREFESYEKHRTKVKKRVDTMTTQWRKRRRLCMDFLINMEENTDGTISVKKCLSGDGQIYIESDDVAIKGAKEYAINQKRRVLHGKRPRHGVMASNKKQKLSNSKGACSLLEGIVPDESFISVDLDSRGMVQRVYLDE